MGSKRIGLNVRNAEALLADLPRYYDLSVTVLQDFGGPSVYFHRQALLAQAADANFLGVRHIEMIYATLASWGMHRMGDPRHTRAKMVEFDVFRTSLLRNRTGLEALRQHRIETLSPARYNQLLASLNVIFSDLQVSISDSKLVANAKTLAHILPALLPPIDRQYTVRFFQQDATEFFTEKGDYRLVQVPKEENKQFAMYVSLCTAIKALFDQALIRHPNLFQVNGQGFNTSYPKIIDNLIMAFVKTVKPPQNTP